jgi:hypothetical protein
MGRLSQLNHWLLVLPLVTATGCVMDPDPCSGDAVAGEHCGQTQSPGGRADVTDALVKVGDAVAAGVNGANYLQKAPQRAVWWNLANVMEWDGMPVAAAMLRHSLQDEPAKLVPYPASFPPIVPLLEQSPELDAVIRKIPDGTNWRDGFRSRKIVFEAQPDLHASLHGAEVRLRGHKESANDYQFTVIVSDHYDFDWKGLNTQSLKRFVFWGTADVAFLSQSLGAITGYDVATVLEKRAPAL